MANARAARKAKAAKKNIWKLTTPMPERSIDWVTASLKDSGVDQENPEVADRTGWKPMATPCQEKIRAWVIDT